MTQMLENIIDEIRQLPADEQDMYAVILRDQLADNKHWQQQFAASQGQLAKLAKKVREDIQAGLVEDVDPVRSTIV